MLGTDASRSLRELEEVGALEGLARGGAGGGWCCVPGGPELTELAARGKSGERHPRVISTQLSVTTLPRGNLIGPDF